MTTKPNASVSRRKALAGIAAAAVGAYTIPAFTSLSVAHAASAASAASDPSAASAASAVSEPSVASTASSASASSTPSVSSGPSRSSDTMSADECVNAGGVVVQNDNGALVCDLSQSDVSTQ